MKNEFIMIPLKNLKQLETETNEKLPVSKKIKIVLRTFLLLPDSVESAHCAMTEDR